MLPASEASKLRIIRSVVDELGEDVLAELLRVRPEDIRHWLSGEQVPADGILFVALAILQQAHRESANKKIVVAAS